MRVEFAVGVVSSIVATMLIVASSYFVRRWRVTLKDLVRRLRLARELNGSGLLYFFPSRSDYDRFRRTDTQAAYLRLAKRRIEVVGHSFGYAQGSQGVSGELEGMLKRVHSLEITFAILDPRSSHVGSLARYMQGLPESASSVGDVAQAGNDAEERLRANIESTLSSFWETRQEMPEWLRSRFTIKVYDALPVASVIMLDRGDAGGRTQIDIKVFSKKYHNSISFELGRGGSAYRTATGAWGSLIDSAEVFEPSRHLRKAKTSGKDQGNGSDG